LFGAKVTKILPNFIVLIQHTYVSCFSSRVIEHTNITIFTFTWSHGDHREPDTTFIRVLLL